MLLRGDDRHHGHDAQYIAAVAQPEYRTAFLKLLQFGPAAAAIRMTAGEQEAVQEVVAAEQLRAMSYGGTAGLGVPLVIDPTIVVSSAGTRRSASSRRR